MRKIVITIFVLLFVPITVSAAYNDLNFAQDTYLDVNGITLRILAGSLVEEMVVSDTTVVFTLASGSDVTIRSYDRKVLGNNLGIDLLCGGAYSQISASGALGSSLTITPSTSVCTGTVGGGGGGGGGGGAGVPVTTTPTVPTTTTGEVTATASGGGETTLTTDENTTAAVELPANAVSVSTDIAIETEAKDTVTSSRPAPSSRSVIGSYVYNYTALAGGETVSSFDQNLTLTFTYTDDQISGLEESTLRVFYWKEATSQWVALPTTIDADSNSLTATTNHFTYFVIMGLTEGEEEEEDLVEEEVEEEVTIVDGDLIRNPDAAGMAQFDIYIVKLAGTKKFKRLILSPHVFESYEHFDKNGNGSPWDDVLDVGQSVMDEYTTSDLVRAVEDTKVYKLVASGDTGTKQWLNMTAANFVAQGYDSDSIYEINTTDRDAYTTGADITVEGTDSETIIIKVATLRVRSLPSLDGDILTNVSEGEVYDLLDEQDGWYKITANSVTGWCYGGDTGGYAAKQ